MHKFNKSDYRRVQTYESCAICDRTHVGYTVGDKLELGFCDDHQEQVEEIVDSLDNDLIQLRKSS